MKWIYYFSTIIVLVACVSPSGVRRVKKQFIHQQKEDAYSGLIQNILKKSSSKLQYFSIDNEEVPTIRLINKDDSGIVNWGKEIVEIQNRLEKEKIAYSSICVINSIGKKITCYDAASLVQFEEQNQFVNSFLSKLKENNRPILNPFIDFSVIHSNNMDDLLEYIGKVETVKIKDFTYYVDDLNTNMNSTFTIEMNDHIKLFLVVEKLKGRNKLTRLDLISS